MSSKYHEQVRDWECGIDNDFWRNPTGVDIDYDTVRYLYIPDSVFAYIISQIGHEVYRYQIDNISTKQQITHAVMVTMGGILPGVFLHDHLAWTLNKNIPPIQFGTLGVLYYADYGQPLDKPEITFPLSVDVDGKVVGVVEDVVDLGGTAKFVTRYLIETQKAKKAVLIAPYLKNTDVMETMEVINFGYLAKDTWLITPRERVETLLKRVPIWLANGASLEECAANLRKIGYSEYLLDIYLYELYESG